MTPKHKICSSDETIAPMLEALDSLRDALDQALLRKDEAAAGLIVWSLKDLADTIDLIRMGVAIRSDDVGDRPLPFRRTCTQETLSILKRMNVSTD